MLSVHANYCSGMECSEKLLDLKKQLKMSGGNTDEGNPEIQKLLGSFGVGKSLTMSSWKVHKQNIEHVYQFLITHQTKPCLFCNSLVMA
jgi:hypothetical protein